MKWKDMNKSKAKQSMRDAKQTSGILTTRVKGLERELVDAKAKTAVD
jgi:hypothetical protein